MESLFILIPIAVVFTVIAISAFFWAVGSKQYDDLDSAGERILFDEPVQPERLPGEQEKTHDH